MSVFINDLVEHGEYIDYGKSRLICFSEQGNYLIGDKEFHVSYNKQQKFVGPDVDVLKITRHPKTIVKYVMGEKELSPKNYYDIKYKHYDEDDDQFSYSSLEVEFEHRKELEVLKQYEPVYHQDPDTIEPVDLKCVGSIEDTGSKYISTAISFGKKGFGNSGFYKVDYTAAISNTFWEFVDENNLRDKTHNGFNRGYVRFAKINGSYVVSECVFGAEEGKFKYHHDLDQAKAELNKALLDFKRKLKVKVFGSEMTLDKVTLKRVIVFLENTVSSVGDLDCKQKAYNSKRTLVNNMHKELKELRELVDKY